ncbi:TPA: hypothetical protein I1462_001692 [Staphylococcus pseudintermedius]|uniref:DUF3168 domain-containing protein n=1 Tax=Staphylococcus pseudintermedius TaxID=283734 RepID=A0A317Z7C2_STAPS|nr:MULTISPECIES: hypothetical protein [Staphylococcus]ANS89876.1 hypothetical protein A6M57_7800 [Staphylococcus pseudintermedius]EGQ0370178.1 hypothetical protein [Staphylococcus pseudintermedius]EGQ1292278.1 hypothetical protein [Staphylococcus pseudintermedius]EGQ1315220.1 hypothetical protein [Staphylococcus pseudintermedius]EGQ1603790.1 hypothetical protein [Staphylococcus pseudintermedius]
MSRHPIVRIYNLLIKDDDLKTLLKSEKSPKIFTFDIPENYQKKEYTPLIRITEILLENTLYRDGDSEYYRFLFAVEAMGNDINTTHAVSERVNDIVKSHNGRVISRDLSKEDKLGIFNQMNEYQIILPVKETL